MANKRLWHHYQTKIRKLKPRTLLIILILLSCMAAIGLRSNNMRMLELRQAVFTADKEGEGVEEAINELRTFVYAHMNTDLNSGGVSIKPPIQLKYTYERLVSKQESQVAEHNKKVVSEAPGICEKRFPAGQIRERAACVDDYIAKNSRSLSEPVPKELYQFDFASPSWSPDFAGFTIIASAFVGALLAARLLLGALINHELK